MRGGFLHNNVLIGSIQLACQLLGLKTDCEVHTAAGFTDLVVQTPRGSLAVEAEMSPKRVFNDVAKARMLHAWALWIVVPRSRLARAVRRRFRNLQIGSGDPKICIMTLAQALRAVSRLSDGS